ncbi:class I SAM-dependent methyltransferase [Evansella sp. AB-rgal1]|uniref:class I SAM-dependent methyltransferase n=1 Tax=Evansella sp. AB-rgal1 TaxID=3242696 RepID=UPI00359D3C38
MNKIEHIRYEEKKYHTYCYDNYTLFESGSWLSKPVQSIVEMMQHFEDREDVQVLDLGSGVGRNSIPIAQHIGKKKGKVVCVDFLDSALTKLESYCQQYEVKDRIAPIKSDIGEYIIPKNTFNYIIAVSSLEHVESEVVFDRVLESMVKGTKRNGINYLIVNSNYEELDKSTGSKLDPLLEVNLTTELMMEKLKTIYSGWEELSVKVKPLSYEIQRGEKEILLSTNAITFVVKKQH